MSNELKQSIDNLAEVLERVCLIDDSELTDRSQEAQYYNYMDEKNAKLEQENDKLREESEAAATIIGELIELFPDVELFMRKLKETKISTDSCTGRDDPWFENRKESGEF